MKRYAVALLISGILIQLAALFGEHATEIPFIMRTVAPAYYQAQRGLQIIKQVGVLHGDDDGFSEISTVLIELTHKRNPQIPWLNSRIIDDIKVGGIRYVGASQIVYIHFTISDPALNGAPSNERTTLEQVIGMVDDLKRLNVLSFCFGIFVLGSMINIIAFLVERSQSPNPCAESRANNPPEQGQTTTEEQQEEHGTDAKASDVDKW